MSGQSKPPPQAVVMQMMMAAWAAQAISAVTRLGVADALEKHGASTARELTEIHGIAADSGFLARALRACASVGIFTESGDGRFGPTELSRVLTPDAPGSVRAFVELIGGRWWPLIGRLPEALRTGQHQQPGGPWQGGNPDHTAAFARAMRSRVQSTRGVVEHADFSRARHVVDVGGSFGHLAIALLERYPHLRATVLELPDVIPIAERHAASEDPALRARLTFVAGDMFAEVPAGDTYLLKAIIHDWDDDHAVRVLSNCHARLPDGGRVICSDNVLPPVGDTGASGTKLLDMLMMVSGPGKERTEQEWRALYAAAGLSLASITQVSPQSAECLIEGSPSG
jgi:SAM-dependent methyltransferase